MEDWDDIRFFLAVGRAGSFNAAARDLAASQPTVGRRIAALEARIGAPLFDRRHDGLGLTEFGVGLWDHALAIEAAALGFERRLAARSNAPEGTVKVSTTDGLGALWLTPRLAEFAGRHPALSLQVLLDNQAADLLRRQADIALRLSRPMTPELIARKVGELGFGLFASPDYLERHGEPRSIGDLARHRLVTLALRQSTLDEVWQDVIDGGAAIAFSTNSSLAQIGAVRAGYGIGLLPFYVGGLFDLAPVLEGQAWRGRDIWLVAHPDVKASVKVRVVFDEIARLFQVDGMGLVPARERPPSAP